MAIKIAKEDLLEIGCINPDEYKGVRTSNLKFKCIVCGDVFTTSLISMRQKKERGNHKFCTKCANDISKKNKIAKTKEKLRFDYGCLNHSDYKNSTTNNLKFKCEECGDIYTMSLDARKNQMKRGLNTCLNCSMENARRNQKDKSKKELVNLGCLNPNDYVNTKVPNMKFRCSDCGSIYTTSLNERRQQFKKGLNTCKKCSFKNVGLKQMISKEEIVNLGCLNPNDYVNIKTNNLKFKCERCNDIYITSLSTRKKTKRGICTSCSNKNIALSQRVSKDVLISYGCINPDDYVNTKTSNLKFKCSNKDCNNIIEDRSLGTYYQGYTKCSKCAKSISKPEVELIESLKEIGIKEEEIKSQQRILKIEDKPPLELDIYLPNHNFAIEFHGDRYHSVWFKHGKESEIVDKPRLKSLHHEKYLLAKEQGIRLIQIHEHEWNNPNLKEKLKGLIKHSLGKSNPKAKIYARKCIVRRIDKKRANLFLDKYHLQGSTQQGTVDLGLFYNDELVAVTSFVTSSLSKRHKDKHELIRHATNTSYLIIGALGKTLAHYKKNYHSKIYTFCDVEKFNGQSYIKTGFKETYFSKPQYFYVVDGIKYHKRLLQRQKIANKFPNFKFKTYGESSMLKELINEGYQIFKIFDAGKICYESC